MFVAILWAILGYLLGNILFAKVFGILFHCSDKILQCKDQNPGTANAFLAGGFFCGMLTLIGDMLKGFLPVFLYVQLFMKSDSPDPGLILVLAAPVIGHMFPLLYHFQGGKGIATAFGSLLGLSFDFGAVLTFAFYFVFFSIVLTVSPHFYRTLITYLLTAVTLFLRRHCLPVCLGYMLITITTTIRFHFSKEEKEPMKVRFLWMH